LSRSVDECKPLGGGGGGWGSDPAREENKNRETARSARREADIAQRLRHPNVMATLMHHTGRIQDSGGGGGGGGGRRVKGSLAAPAEAEVAAAVAAAAAGAVTAGRLAPWATRMVPWHTILVSEFCIGGSLRSALQAPENTPSRRGCHLMHHASHAINANHVIIRILNPGLLSNPKP